MNGWAHPVYLVFQLLGGWYCRRHRRRLPAHWYRKDWYGGRSTTTLMPQSTPTERTPSKPKSRPSLHSCCIVMSTVFAKTWEIQRCVMRVGNIMGDLCMTCRTAKMCYYSYIADLYLFITVYHIYVINLNPFHSFHSRER